MRDKKPIDGRDNDGSGDAPFACSQDAHVEESKRNKPGTCTRSHRLNQRSVDVPTNDAYHVVNGGGGTTPLSVYPSSWSHVLLTAHLQGWKDGEGHWELAQLARTLSPERLVLRFRGGGKSKRLGSSCSKHCMSQFCPSRNAAGNGQDQQQPLACLAAMQV